MPTRNRFSVGPQLPELMGPPDPAKRKRTAIRAEVASKAKASLISPQAREKARQQADMDSRKYELSQVQHKNKMFREEMANYKMLQELEQLTADIEAQKPVEEQKAPVPSMEEELAKMTPEQAMSIDPDSEDFKQLIVVGGESAVKIWREQRQQWARDQTKGLYNQGSTKIDEQWYTPDQLASRREALSRGTRSPEAIDELNYLRDMAQRETAYNAGYRPPVLPPQEPFTLSQGQTRYGQYGQPVATAPQVTPQISPDVIERGRQQAEQNRLGRTSAEQMAGERIQSAEKIASERREPKRHSDLEERYIESQIAKNTATGTKAGVTPFAAAKALETLSPEKYKAWLKDYIQKQIEPPGTTPHPSTQVAKLDAMINDPYATRTDEELKVLEGMKDEYLKLWQGSLADGIGIEDVINNTKTPTNLDELKLQMQEMFNAGIDKEEARIYYNRMKAMLSGN